MVNPRDGDGAGRCARSSSRARDPRRRRRPQEELLRAEEPRGSAAHAARPEAAGALAALATLDEDVDPRALESAVRGGRARRARTRWSRRRRRGSWRISTTSGAQTAEAAPLRASLGSAVALLRHRPVRRGARQLERGVPAGDARPPRRDRAKTYPGKTHEVGWRAADARDARRRALPGRAAASRRTRRSPTSSRSCAAIAIGPAVLRLGSPGPIKVWVNGAAVFTHDVVRARRARSGRGRHPPGPRLEPDPDQDRRSATAPGGSSRASPTPAGAPLALRRRAPARRRCPRDGAAGVDAAGAAAPTTLDALLERRARAARGGRGGAAWIDLGARARLDDAAGSRRPRRVGGVRAGVRAAAPRAPRRAAGAGAAARRPPTRPTTTTSAAGMLEQALRRAAAAAVAGAAAGARWASAARAARRDARALEAWREALAIDPECWPAALAIAQEEADAGLPLTARGPARGAARVQSGAAARAARGGAPVRRRRPAARGRSRAGRSRAAIAGRTPTCMHQLSIRARRARRRRRGAARGWRRWWRCAPTCRRWRSSWRACWRARATRSGRSRRCAGWRRGCPTSRRRWSRWASCCTGWGRATRRSRRCARRWRCGPRIPS